jgi:DNA-binding transcriptional ArsR family regulator
MPRGKAHRAKPVTHLPALIDPGLIRALDHVLRQHILLAAVQGEVSPSEIAKTLDEGLSQISYHFKVLRDDCGGIIEETRTAPRRGAVEHYYRANVKTLLPAKPWRRLKKGLRAAVGAGMASDLFNDLAEALQAGKLQGAHDYVTRTPLVLDAEGQRNIKAIAERATEEAEAEQRKSSKRVEKANGDGAEIAGCIFGLLAFEAAWKPADLHALVQQAEGTASASANGVGQNGGGSKRGGRRKAGVAEK